MKRKFLILLCLILFFVSVSGVSAAEDVNQTINGDTNNVVSTEDTLSVSLSDDEIMGSADKDTFTVLQKKIDDASEGSIINLENNYIYDSGFSIDGINIDKNLTIDGNGYTIDGNHVANIFTISSDVTLINIKFINAFENEYMLTLGGGAISSNGVLTINDCTFANNYDEWGTGAISSGGVLTINGCTFVNNTSEWSASAISADVLTINDCTFVNNSGGAIGSNQLTITNSIFVNNAGGAIGSSTELIAKNCSFVNNSGRNGAIYTQTYEKISIISDCNFVNNSGEWAGAIFSEANLTINDCNFVNNSGEWAGAIYSNNILTINDCSYKNNSGEWAGAIYSNNVLTINGCNFVNNSVHEWYSIIFSTNNLTINDSNFENNSGIQGGAVHSSDKLIVKNSRFAHNHGDYYAGAVYCGGESSFSGCIFDNNRESIGAAVSIFLRVFSDIKDSTFIEEWFIGKHYNVSQNELGGVVWGDSDFNLINCTLIGSPAFVSAPNLSKYFKGPERFVVTIKNQYDEPIRISPVTIYLNGQTYNRKTDMNGQASMAINLNTGVYNVTTEYYGIIVNSTITVKSTVSGNDVTKIFKNGTQYYATFVDTKGNLIKNTDVKFNINGVFYTRTTDDKGVAKMNINLPPKPEGYIITAENPNSTEKYTNVIKVLPSIVENYDLTKYYKNASKYTLRVIGDNGKPVGEGVTVKLNINGVFYERKTNASGYMSMNINLPPGKYTVTAEYNGLKASNTINVLSTLETKDLSMKYEDGSKFEAKILDGQGRPYAGQNVTFNINGVLYHRTTGDDGVARLTINLMAGEYIITSTYNGLNSANKVTISG